MEDRKMEIGNNEHRNFYNLMEEIMKRVIKGWKNGEANIVIEIRNDGHENKKAKIHGGEVSRIGN